MIIIMIIIMITIIIILITIIIIIIIIIIFALVVAPALPPFRFCASACGGRLRLRVRRSPRVASGRAACSPQGRLPRGHGAGGVQCSRVESRRDSLLAAKSAVRSAAAVVHFTDRGQQPTPLARANWGSVRGA